MGAFLSILIIFFIMTAMFIYVISTQTLEKSFDSIKIDPIPGKKDEDNQKK